MEANPHKIGTGRQQNDNRIAVQQATGLGEYWLALAAKFETEEMTADDYLPNQMEVLRLMRSGDDSPAAQAWITSCVMADKAISVLQRAIATGQLPIWRIPEAREVTVTPLLLERGNVKNGLFKTHAWPEPDMQGAELWVKLSDWNPFFGSTGTCRNPAHVVAMEAPDPRATRSRGRPLGSGSFHDDDAPLLVEMAEMVKQRRVRSPTAAADAVADKAAGPGTRASKVDRLRKAYFAMERNGV